MTPRAAPGVYALMVRLAGAEALARGTLAAGYYVYVGRAMSGLAPRLARHLRTRETRHWHVDALLAAGTVVDVQVRFTDDPADECRTAAEVARWPGAEPVPRFGASDCACATHLFRFRRRPGASLVAPLVVPALDDLVKRLYATYGDDPLGEPDEPWRTLAACILSLRTRDPVTDAAAKRLFRRWPTSRALAAADPAKIAPVIFPVGMYNEKAKTLVAIATMIETRFGGRTPARIDELLELPGVGRKTANLVRSFAYRLPAVCVDTHVHRITNRWGLVRTATPDETELELRRLVPERHWIDLNPLLVRHGQATCQPRVPHCERCPLAGPCRFDLVERARELLRDVPGAPGHPALD